jgi:hypothetical protein
MVLLLKYIVFFPRWDVVPYVGPDVIVTVLPAPDLSVQAVIGAVPVTVLESAASNHRTHPVILSGVNNLKYGIFVKAGLLAPFK